MNVFSEETSPELYLRDVEKVGYRFFSSLISTAYVVSFALVGYESPMWLHDDRIKVFHTVILDEQNQKLVSGRVLLL